MLDKIITTLDDTTIERLRTEGGVFLIDKPLEWTSFDVVNKLRYRLKNLLKDKKLKVGHAGTLDPLATGLLIVCVGKMTKQIDAFMGQAKSYTGTIRLGATTPTYDRETAEDAQFPIEHITPLLLEASRERFLGEIYQLPPIYSAIKQSGPPLYELARKGKEVVVEPRCIRIHQFDIERITDKDINFYVNCSKGTYIRSLAFDFGKACESGGYLTALRRTGIGDFSIEKAWDLEVLTKELEGQTPSVNLT
jgi:tRNA pseudouridine55 synthase